MMNIKNSIPNTITCCNLMSGCIATMFAFMGRLEMALLLSSLVLCSISAMD